MTSPLALAVLHTARTLLVVLTLALSSSVAFGQTPNEARNLSPNQPLESAIKGGETHAYQFQLEAGQFAQVEVVQSQIDLSVSLYGTDGKLSATLEGKGGRLWRETLSCLAEAKGVCRVEISASEKDAPAGSYTVKLTAPRAAAAPDRERLLAERALGEGRQLYESNKRDEALAKYEEAAALWQKVGDKYWEAVTLLNLGIVRNNLSKNDEAKTTLERALLLMREGKDRPGEGKSLVALGNIYKNPGQSDKAINYYAQALAIYQELSDRREQIVTLSSLGNIYESLNQYEKARDYKEQVLTLRRELKDRRGEANSLTGLGQVYNNLSQFEKARDYLEQALAIRKEMKDRLGEGLTLLNLGIAYMNLSQNEKASDAYEQALAILVEIKNRRGQAFALNNLGILNMNAGKYDRARDYYEQALVIIRELKDVPSQNSILGNLGAIYYYLGEYQKAQDYYEQTLALSRELKDKSSEHRMLNNLGKLYDNLGQYQKAQDYYEQALALSREIKDRYGEALMLDNLGVTYDKLHQFEKARVLYEQALSITREIKDRDGEGYVLSNLGIVYDDLGEYEKARGYLEQALSIWRENNDRLGESLTLNSLGGVYENLRQPEKAWSYLGQALAINLEIKDRYHAGVTLNNLMQFHQKRGERAFAILCGKQAVNAYQEIRSNIKGLEQESRRSFLKTAEETYRELTALLLAENRVAEAQQVLNSFKDQRFFDFNRTSQQQPAPLKLTPHEAAFVARYEQVVARRGTLRQQLDELQHTLGKRTPTPEEASRARELTGELQTLSDEFLALFKQAGDEFKRPQTAQDRVGEIEDTAQMQAALRELSAQIGQKAVAIYTLVGEESFSVLLITPSETRRATVPVKAADFNKKVLLFYRALKSPAYDPRPVGKELYDIIFKPIAPEIRRAGAKTLLWSLDGTLAYVPMAALSPDGRSYLVERYQNVVFTRADKERWTRGVSPNWVGTGFGSSEAHALDLLGEKLKLPALPGVARELDAVFRAGDSDGIFNGEVYADANFKKETFFGALKQGRPLVHISSHFIFRPGDDTRSFLLLGDGTPLTLNEMKGQEHLFEGVELLTLSACDTAAQQPDANGREIDGFAELAQRLGAGAVIASLWSVADQSTADLMTRFYRIYKLSPNRGKGAALRRAQLALLGGLRQSKRMAARRGNEKVKLDNGESLTPFVRDDNAPFAHPFYWSPFILIGNWH